MVAYITRLPAGFPGQVSRDDALTIEAGIIDSSTPPTAYGAFCKVVSGKIQPLASGDAGSVVHGLLAQPFPVQASTVVSALNSAAVPPTSGVIGVLRRGFIAVTLVSGTAAKKGQVYVVTTAGGTSVVGDIVTSSSPSSGGTAVAVTGAYFTGPADANGVVEIEFNL